MPRDGRPGLSAGFAAERDAVASAAREMERLGLVSGSSGNVSVRVPGAALMAITPMGLPYSDLSGTDVVVVDAELEPVDGDGVPSSESLLHKAIYEHRPAVGAVVHTHAIFSSVAAVVGRDIPPIVDEMVVHVGGDIRVSEYAFPGTAELAERVLLAMEGRSATIIRNHGAVGVGRSADEALRICALVERVATIHAFARMSGTVGQLPPEVVEREQAVYRMRTASRGPGAGG